MAAAGRSRPRLASTTALAVGAVAAVALFWSLSPSLSPVQGLSRGPAQPSGGGSGRRTVDGGSGKGGGGNPAGRQLQPSESGAEPAWARPKPMPWWTAAHLNLSAEAGQVDGVGWAADGCLPCRQVLALLSHSRVMPPKGALRARLACAPAPYTFAACQWLSLCLKLRD